MADKSSIDKKYWYDTLIPHVISIKINSKKLSTRLKIKLTGSVSPSITRPVFTTPRPSHT